MKKDLINCSVLIWIVSFRNLWILGENGEPTIQYCNIHFNNSNNSTKSSKIFDFELQLHKILFDEIEEQLIYIQDKIDYIKSYKNQKNMNLYVKIEDEVQRNLDNINSIFKTITKRIYQIDETYKTNNIISLFNFENFSFVRKDLTKWRENILTILSLISEPSSKNQAAFLIRARVISRKKLILKKKGCPSLFNPSRNIQYRLSNG